MKNNSIKYQSSIISTQTGVAIAATIITTTTTTTTPAASESAAHFEQDWASVGLDFAVGRDVDTDIDIDLLLADDTGRQFDVFQQPSLSPEEEASLILDLQHSDFNLFENTPVPSLNAQPPVTMENNQGMHASVSLNHLDIIYLHAQP